MYDNLCAIKLCYASEVRLSIGFQEFCRNFFVNENGTCRERYILITVSVPVCLCDEIFVDNLWVFHDHESLGLNWQLKKTMINMLQLFVF